MEELDELRAAGGNGFFYRGDRDLEGLKHGNGTMSFPNGSQYVGEFRNNKKNGRGVMTYPNGKKWEGEFRNGKTVRDD